MTDFEIPAEVRDAIKLSEFSSMVDQLQDALHKAAILQRKLDISYLSLANDAGNVKIVFVQNGDKTFGRVDKFSNRFTRERTPSPAKSITDEPE